MKLEAILAIAYVIAAFGTFTAVVTWSLRRAGPDFPSEPEATTQPPHREIEPAQIKRAA